MNRTIQYGFTLIELIVFIIIISIVAGGILLGFNVVLSNQPNEVHNRRALEIANSRMEYIVGQAQINGFNSFSDNCSGSTPAICAHDSDYTISSDISVDGSNANIKIIKVDVSGKGYASLTSAVASL